MTEFLVGLVVGALCMLPAVWSFRERLFAANTVIELRDETVASSVSERERLLLKLEARTFTESAGLHALLDRPDPEPEQAGRWIHSDDGLVSSFIPDQT